MTLNNENNNNCCKCTTPQYELVLNEQGPQGKTGPQGEPGFSPKITVSNNDYNTYTLKIQTADGVITTPNLKSPLPAGGSAGQVLKKVSDANGDIGWGDIPPATTDLYGTVQLATITDTQPNEEDVIDDTKAVTPNVLVEYVEQEIGDADDLYVTLNSSQTINGTKTFTSNVVTNGITTQLGGVNLISRNAANFDISVGTSSTTLSRNLILASDSDGSLIYQKGSTQYNLLDSTNQSQLLVDLASNQTVAGRKIFQDGIQVGYTSDASNAGQTLLANGIQYSPEGTYTSYVIQPDIENQANLLLGSITYNWNNISLFGNNLFFNSYPVLTSNTLQNYLIAGDNITLTPGTGGRVTIASSVEATTDYTELTNKPQINGVELTGNQTGNALGLANESEVDELGNELNQLASNVTSLETSKQDILTAGEGITITNNVISATGGTLPDNVLTSDNISQDAYIQQLEARIAALEALIDGGNSSGASLNLSPTPTPQVNSAIPETGYVGVDTVTVEDGE